MKHVLDVIAESGIPFRVVYGKRTYLSGKESVNVLVSFYDRRYPSLGEHGQFVSDYYPETLMDDRLTSGLNLHGGEDDWSIDAKTMSLVFGWLEQFA